MPASATARALYPPFLLPRPPAWGLPGAGRAEGEEFFFFLAGVGEGGRRAEGRRSLRAGTRSSVSRGQRRAHAQERGCRGCRGWGWG